MVLSSWTYSCLPSRILCAQYSRLPSIAYVIWNQWGISRSWSCRSWCRCWSYIRRGCWLPARWAAAWGLWWLCSSLSLHCSCLGFQLADLFPSPVCVYFIFFMSSLLIELFIYSHCGENMKQASADFAIALYDSDWVQFAPATRRTLILTVMLAQRPCLRWRDTSLSQTVPPSRRCVSQIYLICSFSHYVFIASSLSLSLSVSPSCRWCARPFRIWWCCARSLRLVSNDACIHCGCYPNPDHHHHHCSASGNHLGLSACLSVLHRPNPIVLLVLSSFASLFSIPLPFPLHSPFVHRSHSSQCALCNSLSGL